MPSMKTSAAARFIDTLGSIAPRACSMWVAACRPRSALGCANVWIVLNGPNWTYLTKASLMRSETMTLSINPKQLLSRASSMPLARVSLASLTDTIAGCSMSLIRFVMLVRTASRSWCKYHEPDNVADQLGPDRVAHGVADRRRANRFEEELAELDQRQVRG